MINDNYYKTSDLALAASLSLYSPVNTIDSTDSKRIIFIFKQSQELDQLVDMYWRGEMKVDPQQYFNQLKIIKSRIYSRI